MIGRLMQHGIDKFQPISQSMNARWKSLRKVPVNPLTVFGLGVVSLMILLGLLAPWLAPYPPYEVDPARGLLTPSPEHLFGTDQYGQDVFSRVLHGTRITLFVAILAVILGLMIGTALGGVAGYFGAAVDELIMRCMDMLQAFPSFVLAMAVAMAVGPGLITLVVANAVVNVPYYARILRSKMLSVKQTQYASAAICAGNTRSRIVFLHLLPNCVGPLVVQATLQSGWAILSAAGLSFLGLGMRVPAAEWGAMIQMGTRFMVTGEWWIAFFPGLAIVFAVIGFNLLGDGLRDLLEGEKV